MKILFQFPTRDRVSKFFKTLELYYENICDINNVQFHIVISEDDSSMNNEQVLSRLNNYKRLSYSVTDKADTKIKACNYGIEQFIDFDILALISDDMIPQKYGFDEDIRMSMKDNFPNTDGALGYFDGYQNRICTLSIMGRKYFERFNYIYHPDYKSLFCDNEFTDVAKSLDKIVFIDRCIIKHEHPFFNSKVPLDNLYNKNNELGGEDSVTFNKRRLNNFAV